MLLHRQEKPIFQTICDNLIRFSKEGRRRQAIRKKKNSFFFTSFLGKAIYFVFYINTKMCLMYIQAGHIILFSKNVELSNV